MVVVDDIRDLNRKRKKNGHDKKTTTVHRAPNVTLAVYNCGGCAYMDWTDPFKSNKNRVEHCKSTAAAAAAVVNRTDGRSGGRAAIVFRVRRAYRS